jgi:predicted phage-related endonuclease
MKTLPLVVCKKLDPLKDKEAWKQLRMSGIGGSDAGSICGVNPYSSGLEVFFSKLGELPERDDNEAMEWGRTLEPIIAEKFAKKTVIELLPAEFVLYNSELMKSTVEYFEVTDPSAVYCHPEYKYLFANPDRLLDHPVLGEGILEIKTSNEYNYSDWMEGNIPQSYILQVQHYLYVMDRSYAFIAALIGGNKFRTFFILRDENVIQPMIKQETDFWQRIEKYHELHKKYIVELDPEEEKRLSAWMEDLRPALRYGEDASKLIKSKFPEAIKDTMKELPEHLEDAAQWLRWKAAEKEAKDKKDFHAQRIQAAMGATEKAAIGELTAVYDNRSRSGYTVEPCTYRQFTIKEPKTKNLRG